MFQYKQSGALPLNSELNMDYFVLHQRLYDKYVIPQTKTDKRERFEGVRQESSDLDGESYIATEKSQKTVANIKKQQIVKDDRTKDKRERFEGVSQENSGFDGETHIVTENSQTNLANWKDQKLVKDDGTKDKREKFEGVRQEISDLNRESHIATENSQKPLANLKEQKLVKDDGTKDESAQWQDCIQSKDAEKIRHLLQEGSLPDRKQLQYAYTKFMEENTDIMKEICLAIEERITSKNNSIVSTHACYKDGRKNEIVFVILTSQAKDQLLDIRYPFHSISIDEYDGDAVIIRERQEKLSFDGDEFADLTECLRTNSPDLMEKHSNLTNTSISHFKSSKEDGLKKASCIVFYVFAKGFIPIGEEPLPLYLKSQTKTYITDVRESRFAEISRGPDEEHQDLKTGCRIESSKVLDGGTLGGFVTHPKHGLCAVTCSHVLLDISQFENLYQKKQKKEEVETLTEIQCFQPQQPHKCGEIVDVRLFGTNERKYGMDIAFFKVDDSRKPKTNTFPDILAKDVKGKHTPYLDDLLSKTFQYNSTAVIQHPNNLSNVRHVVKYGARSRLTTGEFFSYGSFARIQFYGHSFSDERIPKPKSSRPSFSFTDLIEIRDDGMIFSESGDSGAMVFITDGNNELSALGILTGRKEKDGITYVTPIWNILEEIEMPMPYSLAENSPVSNIIERLERAVGDLKQHFNASGNMIDQ